MVLFLIFILEVGFQYETTFSHCVNKNGGFVLRGLVQVFTSAQGRTQSPQQLSPDRAPQKSLSLCPFSSGDSGLVLSLFHVRASWKPTTLFLGSCGPSSIFPCLRSESPYLGLVYKVHGF